MIRDIRKIFDNYGFADADFDRFGSLGFCTFQQAAFTAGSDVATMPFATFKKLWSSIR